MSVKFVRLSLAAIAALTISVASAQADTLKDIENRQSMFTAAKVHMGALVAVAKGAPYTEETKLHAQGMLALAMQAPRMFPEGSDMGETGALPVIWEKPEAFKVVLEGFRKSAQMVAEAEGANFGNAVNELGNACKACHDDFRQKK
ncbi:cytochrome c [Magnetospira thiophila]